MRTTPVGWARVHGSEGLMVSAILFVWDKYKQIPF